MLKRYVNHKDELLYMFTVYILIASQICRSFMHAFACVKKIVFLINLKKRKKLKNNSESVQG